MKKIIITFFTALLITCTFGQTKDASYYCAKGYQVFRQQRVAVKAPVVLQDVSRQSSGDFALNYGGVEDENKPSMASYQFMVSDLPAGYRDIQKANFKR